MRIWSKVLAIAFVLVTALPAASALQIRTPLNTTDVIVYQGERMLFYIDAPANASVVTLFLWYRTLDSQGEFRRGPVLTANETGVATVVFEAKGNYSNPGWWQLTATVLGTPDRAMFWFRVKVDPVQVYLDTQATLEAISVVVKAGVDAVFIGIVFVVSRDVFHEVLGIWRKHRPANAIKWVRTTFGRAGEMFGDELNSMYNQAVEDNPVLMRRAEYRRLTGRWKNDQYEMRQLAERILTVAKRAKVVKEEADVHRKEGLLLSKPDDPHFKDWSDEEAFDIDELKDILPPSVYAEVLRRNREEFGGEPPEETGEGPLERRRRRLARGA